MNIKSLKSKLTSAFSLIELMVVIAIVALLTAIAVPSYQGYLQQSKVTEIFSLASDQMNQWAQQYNLGGSNLPITNSNVGAYISSSELTEGTPATANCTDVNGSLGTVCIVLNTNAGNIDASLDGIVLRFSASETGSPTGDTTNTTITWTCGFANASTSNSTTAASLLSPGNCTGY